jgi:hypothetical protein
MCDLVTRLPITTMRTSSHSSSTFTKRIRILSVCARYWNQLLRAWSETINLVVMMIGILSLKNSDSISSHLLDTAYGVLSLLGVMFNKSCMLNVKHLEFNPIVIFPNSKLSPLLVTSDNRINQQSGEKAADGSRVDRIPIIIEQRKTVTPKKDVTFT